MKAILQIADTGPLESYVVMLRAAGIQPAIPNMRLRETLLSLGCDTVLDPQHLIANMGYDKPFDLETVGPAEMDDPILYFDVKAHRNGPKVWKRWPHLKGRTFWARINGGKPEISVRGGDEVNLDCPILTPNLWYACDPREVGVEADARHHGQAWGGWAYACWPPFVRWDDYDVIYRRRWMRTEPYESPVCLIHNVAGWGYPGLVPIVRAMGVKCYGAPGPDGLIPHSQVPELLGKAIAMVHLKSSDCPGYALYEAIASGCPCVIPRRLIKRMRMEEVFEPGVSCMVFDDWGDDWGRGDVDIDTCGEEIKEALDRLRDPELNYKIASSAYERLGKVMWKDSSAQELKDWFDLQLA